MSKVNCEACAELREYAPDFVLNGVTDTIAASLKNDTGLNPSLTTLHKDCEDLNDANDCLIGRMDSEIEAYDVCDWKQFMHKFLPNLYELLKAIIAAICGLWTNVHNLWDRSDLLCDSIDTVLAIIRGDRPKAHPGEWFQSFKDKISIDLIPGEIPYSVDNYRPSFDADIISGAGCRAGKRLGRWQLNTYYDTDVHPRSRRITVNQPLAVGELIGIVYRRDVPVSDISDGRWKNICRDAGNWQWYFIGGDTIWYISARGYTVIEGVTFNEDLASYGEDNLVFYVSRFVGENRQGRLSALQTVELKTYDL